MLILDFAKAFDTVAHQRLLRKLEYYGVTGHLLRWIGAWLTRREQTVVTDGIKSNSVVVKSGVPQSTVLGPLLFLLYINDIGEETSSTKRLYADDCLLYRKIKTGEDRKMLQEDLDKFVRWADKCQMCFNPAKYYHLQISRSKKQSLHHYEMMGTRLESVKSQTYLGVEITENLS